MPFRPLAAIALALVITLGLPPASVAGQEDEPSVRLASQTAWVVPGGEYGLRLLVDDAGEREDLELAVTVHRAVTSRSQFARTLEDRVATSVVEATSTPLSELVPDAAGAIVVRLPVQDPAAPRDPARLSLRGPGVYPVTVELAEQGGGSVASGFTTHLVLVPETVDGPRLATALVLPIHAPPALQPDGSRRLLARDSDALTAVTTQLEQHADAALSLAPTPETVQALALSDRPEDGESLARLADAMAQPDRQVLAGPYVDIPPALYTGALQEEGTNQLATGTEVLAEILDLRPDPRVRVLSRPFPVSVVDRLRGQQVDRLVVTEDALVPVDLNVTLAQPFQLAAARGRGTAAMVADAGFAEHFAATGDPVLAGHRLLADLAVVYYDNPGLTRGVVVRPPDGWRPHAAFLGTVLNGISSGPLLEGVTLDEAFTVPVATGARRSPLVRQLREANPVRLPVTAIQAGRARVEAFGSLVEPGTPVFSRLEQSLLVAQAASLSEAQRRRYLLGLTQQIEAELGQVRGPSNLSITLTAREGRIPVTIHSDADYPVRVRVRLESDQLRFPEGSTRQLTLTLPNTTERFAVQARTSGAFPLVVRLESPDGRIVVHSSRFTVRSTAASGMGLVLSVGAGSFLVLWWASHAIARRRAATRQRHPSRPDPS